MVRPPTKSLKVVSKTKSLKVAGLRFPYSLTRMPGGISFALSPLATVTLEQVQEAGEWRAHGKTIRHRLLTVSVAYRR